MKIAGGQIHLWYLPMLIGIYMLLPVLRSWVLHAEVQNIRYFLVLFFILQILRSTVMVFVESETFRQVLFLGEIQMVCSYLGYFVWGYYMVHVGIPKKYGKYLYLSILPSMLCNILISNAQSVEKGVADGRIYDSYGLFTFLIATALFLFFTEKGKKWALGRVGEVLVTEVSKATLGIYLTHVGIIDLLKQLGIHSATVPVVGVPLLAILVFLLGCMASALLRRIPRKVSVLNRYLICRTVPSRTVWEGGSGSWQWPAVGVSWLLFMGWCRDKFSLTVIRRDNMMEGRVQSTAGEDCNYPTQEDMSMSDKKKVTRKQKGSAQGAGSGNILGESGIYDAKVLGVPKVMILGIQHMFAMFGATILVPMLTGLDISTTLLFAGLGTLLFHLLTRGKVPVFLGSSFAFLGGYAVMAPMQDAATGAAIDNSSLLPYACFGVACSGLLYLLLALLIKLFGTSRVMKFFPPIVTGPIIIAIGLTLSSSAIGNCSDDWLIALVAIALVIVCNIWGKGMVKIVPIIIGVCGSYLLAAVLGRADFSPVAEASWVGFPIHWERTAFWALSDGNTNLLVNSIITIMPIALATMVEHIGDISAISSTVGKNYIKEPGLHRTLLGDGLATILASLFGAPANTTYGENTGVLSLTKVFDPLVIRIAAGFAILLSFCPKFAAVIGCMPKGTVGGVSLVLYGMISAVGVRNIVETKCDFSKSRNVIIAALILVLSIGIKYSAAEGISFMVGDVPIMLSGLAVGALVGIGLNAVLPGKDYVFDEEKPDHTGVNFAVKGN